MHRARPFAILIERDCREMGDCRELADCREMAEAKEEKRGLESEQDRREVSSRSLEAP